MVDPSYNSELQTDFHGAWTAIDSPDVPRNTGLRSENMSYLPGQCSTRLGFSQAYNANDAMTALQNWISSLGNNLLWYRSSDNSVQMIDIAGPVVSTVIAGDLLAYAATFADAGARLYAAFFSTLGRGASGARVISFELGNYVNDLCFQPPITYVPSAPTEPAGTGTVTPGVHNFGYRIEYRNGFLTRPSPDSGVGAPSVSTFTPVTMTASGDKGLRWTLNTTWPVGAVRVWVMMAPVTNPSQYFFVPGAAAAVIGGTLMSVTINFDISDDILFATGTDVTSSLFLMTQTTTGVAPFYPSVVLTFGDRMIYICTVTDNVGNESGAAYVSEKGNFQALTPDQNLVQLPGLKDLTTGISLDGGFYMFGPQWTYRTTDNGSLPATWAAPQLVDGRRGTLAIRGAEVSPSGIYAWIGSQDGLYYFQGFYPTLPVSYYNQDKWDRINWNSPQSFKIKDDPTVHKVYVLAELIAAETVTTAMDEAGFYLLTWDYTNGVLAEQVQFSMDNIRNFAMGAIEVVQNQLPGALSGVVKRKELWIGSSEAGPILRRNAAGDIVPFRDNGAPIATAWESSLFPNQGNGTGEVYQHHGADIRVKGSGLLEITAYSLDDAQSYDLADIQLAERPGLIPHRSFDLISEGASLLFSQGNVVVDPSFEAAA